MLNKKWQLLTPPSWENVKNLASALNVSDIIAQLLIQRDIKDIKQCQSFLKSDLNNLVEPQLIPNMTEAIRRIEQALHNNEKILIFGDYDVDGITSVVLLKRFFRLLGREVDFYIPHRLSEGYGLSEEAITRIAQKGINLIITVDCGISNLREIDLAKKLGMDIIVTDHHEIPPQLPDCIVVNPKLSKMPEIIDSYFLSGVGIAFKVCWALMNSFSRGKKNSRPFHDFLMDAMSLVALGTIADVAPLIGENRILCSYGLEALRYTKIDGLNALIKQTGLSGNPLKTEDIAFRLGPRLNAAGRMGDSYISAELLLSESPSEIDRIVKQLEQNNAERQKVESKIQKEIQKELRDNYDFKNNFVIVLSSDKWHTGVLGIVAARIADEFFRPTILISTENTVGKGSGRSIPNFHLYEALLNCQNLIVSFGGHKYAAGLQIETSRIDDFRIQLNDFAKKNLKSEDFLPTVEIDSNIELPKITHKLVQEMKKLAPFGESNPEPVFCSHNLQLIGVPKLMGKNLSHLSFFAKQDNKTFRVVAFSKGAHINVFDKLKDAPFSMAYTIQLNSWNGEENIELELVDLKTLDQKQL